MKTSIPIYALLLIPSLIISCSVTKNRNSNESTQNSELQKESEKTSLQKDSEVKGSYQHDKDTSSSGVTFYSTPCPDSSNKVILHVDGSIEAKGNIKDAWHNSKKETTKKDSTNRQTLDSNYQKEKFRNITKTITVTKTVMVERKPDYWGITKWVGGLVGLVAFLVFAYRKWLKRFIPIPL
jgi:hypothetical protein